MTFPFLRPAGCLLGLALALNIQPLHATEQQKVLIVVSGEGRDQGKTRPGFEMDEFAQAYLIFRGRGMGERAETQANEAKAATDEYIRSVAGGATAEIAQAKQLLDSGAITEAEFQQLKQAALNAA